MRLGLIIVSITGTFFLIQFVYYARGHRGEDPPDPIPNSEVKLPIADDTACWWESRSLRAFFCPFHPLVIRADFFCSWKAFFPDSDFRRTRREKICPSDARGLPTARPKPFFEKYVGRKKRTRWRPVFSRLRANLKFAFSAQIPEKCHETACFIYNINMYNYFY